MLLDLPNVKLAQAEAVRSALNVYVQGMDFADAVHLELSTDADALLTFDKAFAKRAAAAGKPVPVQSDANCGDDRPESPDSASND